MPVMARPDALHHITIQRWWLCCVTILLSDCLACLRLRLYRAFLHHRRSRSLGPRRELEHSRNRLPEREARHHADLRTRSPRSDLSARNGARQPALPGRRDMSGWAAFWRVVFSVAKCEAILFRLWQTKIEKPFKARLGLEFDSTRSGSSLLGGLV